MHVNRTNWKKQFSGAVLSNDLQWENKLQTKEVYLLLLVSPHVREFGFRIPRNFCFLIPESEKISLVECGIQLEGSGITLTTKFRWQILESSTWIQNPRLSWSLYVEQLVTWSHCQVLFLRYWLTINLFWMKGLWNRSLPSSKNSHFQNEARCTTFLVKMSLICMRKKNDFHIKGWASTLVLKQRPPSCLFICCIDCGLVNWVVTKRRFHCDPTAGK